MFSAPSRVSLIGQSILAQNVHLVLAVLAYSNEKAGAGWEHSELKA